MCVFGFLSPAIFCLFVTDKKKICNHVVGKATEKRSQTWLILWLLHSTSCHGRAALNKQINISIYMCVCLRNVGLYILLSLLLFQLFS